MTKSTTVAERRSLALFHADATRTYHNALIALINVYWLEVPSLHSATALQMLRALASYETTPALFLSESVEVLPAWLLADAAYNAALTAAKLADRIAKLRQ